MDVDTICETFITKVEVQKKHLYLQILWKQIKDDLFHIKIFDSDSSWSGSFSNENAKKFRERDNINENEEEYEINVKRCLIGDDENYNFEFTSSTKSATAIFSWKRRFKGVNILHGKVSVHRDAIPEPKENLVDILLQLNRDLKTNMKELNSKTENLSEDLEKCKDELEKYVNIKTSLETELYGKFVQLLNTKKNRIQMLEDNLLNFEEPSNITMGVELD